MRRSKITGVGTFVPSNVIKNTDLEKVLDTSDEWIVKRTGIQERRWIEEGQANSDLALEAAKEAIATAGIQKEQIDMIILATLSPDHCFPGTACFLQAKLGVPGIATLDIRQQCTGFIYGLSVADQYIRSGMFQNILVVGSEVHSSGLDKSDRGRDVTVLFGDGAGAVVVSATEVQDQQSEAHIYSTHLHSDGRGAKELWVPAPGSAMDRKERITHAMLDEALHYPKMNGKKVFVEAVGKMCVVLKEALVHNQLSPQEVDLYLFHQANMRINDAVADHLKIPKEKVFNTIQKYGNTTAATIPLGMGDAIKAGRLKPGMLVATAAFGSGFTWASGVFRY